MSSMFKMRLSKSVYVSQCSLLATQPYLQGHVAQKKQLIYCCTCSCVLQLQDCGETNGRTDGQDYCAFVCLIRFDGGNQHRSRAQHNDGTGASGNMSLASAWWSHTQDTMTTRLHTHTAAGAVIRVASGCSRGLTDKCTDILGEDDDDLRGLEIRWWTILGWAGTSASLSDRIERKLALGNRKLLKPVNNYTY